MKLAISRIWILAFCLGLIPLQGQELLVNVSVDYNRVQGDKQVFEDLEQAVSRYLNLQRWSKDDFLPHERIRCNMQITVTNRPSPDYFECSLNLQVYRPIFNTNYETILLNLGDAQFNFNYIAFQPLNYVENSYTDNLTALLNFYAFLVLAYDYDSYSLNGGDAFFQDAQNIINLATTASAAGWKSSGSTKNRYWIMENLQNSSYGSFHKVLYVYHRKGLDMMESDPAKGRKAILDALGDMQKLARQFPLLTLIRTFLDAKDDELVKVFSAAFSQDKERFLEIMRDVNPANMEKYERVNEKN